MNKLVLLLLASIVISLNPLSAQQEGHNNLRKGIALSGYDIVSYFSSKTPIKGNSKYSVKNGDATFYFANAINKITYQSNPDQYQIVYGGWCAYAIGAAGKKVEVDPLTYKIIDGKLYLFYNKYLNNTLDSWNKEENDLKQKAAKNWGEITH